MNLTGLVLSSVLAGVCAGGEPLTRTLVTTVYPLQIAALNVTSGAEGIRVVNLAGPAAGCLHDYQLTPRDLTILDHADVILANGAGLESFLGLLLRRHPEIPVINASEGIKLLQSSGLTNAHVWVSPSRHARQVQAIAEGLAAWDPRQAGIYRNNARQYGDKLAALQLKMNAALKKARSRDIITLHEAFSYFAEDFNLRVVDVIEREPGTYPSSGELASLIRRIRASGVKAVFAEPQYSIKPAELIARETGARVLILDPVVSGPVDREAYLNAMEQNVRVLTRALVD